MIFRYLAIPLGILATFLILWLMWPSPIDPVRWDEPPAPAPTEATAPNGALRAATIYPVGGAGAARGITISADGMVYFGTPSGDIMRLRAGIADDRVRPEHIAHIADAPIFGLAWIDESTLAIATPARLFSLNLTSGTITALSAGNTTAPFGNLTQIAVAGNGTIYFTDSSARWDHASPRPGYYYDMLENRPNGAVYAWDPQTGESALVRDRLYFPNGIAIASDGQSLLVSESFRYMIRRIWIAGPRRGEVEVFAKNLPGIPTGITLDGEGNVIVAMATGRSRLLTAVHRHPGLTRVLIKLPQWLRPSEPRPQGFILRLNEASGRIGDSFHDPDSAINYLSGITVDPGGVLWFGSAFGGVIGRFAPPEPPEHPAAP
ncbi:SMP-30/gluconolactonase/LRE family protein [Maricaulis sp.]|uniref:SMP-30/gluconolactonase/LRE family protein n=1 Tax=Maricaulis sp. TaxID=1486257 RepID=UPI003A8D3D14